MTITTTTANGACSVDFDALVAYHQHELDALEAERLEEHLFECTRCARRAELILQLGAGILSLAQQGQVSSGASSALARRAAEQGLTLRTYRIEPGAEVPCTAAPQDDFVVVRLAVSAERGEAIDIDTVATILATGEVVQQQIADVVVDPESGDLVYMFAGDYVRSIPRSRWVMHARVRGPRGERTLGPFTMQHTPWSGS